jgi:hypothetical protein
MLTACGVHCNESLPLAKQRLDFFSVVLILERLQEILPTLQAKLGWGKGAMGILQPAYKEKSRSTRSMLKLSCPQCLSMLLAANTLDLALYKYAITEINGLAEEKL